MKATFLQAMRCLAFAIWSLRRRSGQVLPVTLAFLLLLAALQALGALHDVSSQLVQEQIARNWRGPYDLLLRPSAAVSQPELASGWINPQSLLETYGGITSGQMARVAALPHVVEVTPLAMAGWQPVTVQVSLNLPPQAGIYRVSLDWNESQASNLTVTDYIEVADLAHLTGESSLPGVFLQSVLLTAHPVYTVMLQALQAILGTTSAAEPELAAQLQNGLTPLPLAHLILKLERLQVPRTELPSCLRSPSCWRIAQQQTVSGSLTFQASGVQLWRFSHANYSATAKQMEGGTISLLPSGADLQGTLYRLPLSGNIALPAAQTSANNASATPILPLTLAQHLPLLPAALHFVPLDQICALNGPACYSGLYVRLNGVEHYSQRSLTLLQATAAAIMARTGLHVDILDGSSPRQVSIQLPSTGQTLSSSWRATGVAVQIVHNEDALQNLLLILTSLVCLLALCSAGILVGAGRRKEALFLSQIGWRDGLLGLLFTLDALLLASPGLLLVSGWLLLFTRLYQQSVFSPTLTWTMLLGGLVIYSATLALAACRPLREQNRDRRNGRPREQNSPIYLLFKRVPWRRLHLSRFSAAARISSLIALIASLALTAAVFLLVLTLLMLANLQQTLAVTVLGNQVSTALALPHVILFGVILSAALLTLLLSTHLRLLARKDEFSLLANLGWERRHVFWRVLRETAWPGLICGVAGAGLALVLLLPGATFSGWLVLLSLCLVGPLCGLAMAGAVTAMLAWRACRRIYLWK